MRAEPSPRCFLAVLLSPRARADALVGWQGRDLKIRIAAPPVAGAANLALLKFLARQLEVNVGRLNLTAGAGGRRKLVTIDGLTEAELERRLKVRLAAAAAASTA